MRSRLGATKSRAFWWCAELTVCALLKLPEAISANTYNMNLS
jgi:hypothetical protein